MINETKIEEVHDILTSIVLNEINIPMEFGVKENLHAVRDCLCWSFRT